MKNAVIGVLATLVVLMGGYLVYDKVIDKDSKEKSDIVEKKDDKAEEKDFDLVEAKKLVDKYFLNVYDYSLIETNTLPVRLDKENYKIYVAMKNAEPTKIDYTCEEAFPTISNNNGQLILKDNNSFWGTCYGSDDSFTENQYTYEDVNKSYKALFGNDSTASKVNVSYWYARYGYSEKYNAYIELSCECGGYFGISGYIYGIDSTKLIGDKLIVNVGYSTYSGDENTGKVQLNTIDGNVEITEKELDNKEAILDKYLDKFDTYEFEFFKEDGTYKLKNVTKK